jgi:hypothetical protein
VSDTSKLEINAGPIFNKDVIFCNGVGPGGGPSISPSFSSEPGDESRESLLVPGLERRWAPEAGMDEECYILQGIFD